MPLPHGFEKALTEKSDEELFDMLAHGADYLPEGLAVIRTEAQRRNLSAERVTELDTRSQAICAQEVQAAQERLSWPVRALMFFFPLGLIQIIIGEGYRNRGYARKHKECWTWMLYGAAFYIAVWALRFALAQI